MTEVGTISEAAEAMITTSPGWGDKPLARRAGTRTLLPSTWLGQTVRLSYVGADGEGAETSAVLLDWAGAGPIFAIAGARVLLGWDRLVMVELVGD